MPATYFNCKQCKFLQIAELSTLNFLNQPGSLADHFSIKELRFRNPLERSPPVLFQRLTDPLLMQRLDSLKCWHGVLAWLIVYQFMMRPTKQDQIPVTVQIRGCAVVSKRATRSIGEFAYNVAFVANNRFRIGVCFVYHQLTSTNGTSIA